MPTLDGQPVAVLDAGAATAEAEGVHVFDAVRETVPTTVTLRDHDFTHPGAVLDMSPRVGSPHDPLAVYEYPAGFSLDAHDDGTYAYGPIMERASLVSSRRR